MEEGSHHVSAAYEKRRVLITGCTGFLGSIIFEKVLWEMGDVVADVVVLINVSGTRGAQDRLWKEVLTSPIFARLKDRHGDAWQSWAASVIIAVEGDLGEEGLGLDTIGASTVAGADIVLHCAALRHGSLAETFSVNTLGTLELLELCEARPTHALTLILIANLMEGWSQGKCRTCSIHFAFLPVCGSRSGTILTRTLTLSLTLTPRLPLLTPNPGYKHNLGPITIHNLETYMQPKTILQTDTSTNPHPNPNPNPSPNPNPNPNSNPTPSLNPASLPQH